MINTMEGMNDGIMSDWDCQVGGGTKKENNERDIMIEVAIIRL